MGGLRLGTCGREAGGCSGKAGAASAGVCGVRGGAPLTCCVSLRESGLRALGRAVPAQQQQLLRVREQQFQRIQLGQQRLGVSSGLTDRTKPATSRTPKLCSVPFHG